MNAVFTTKAKSEKKIAQEGIREDWGIKISGESNQTFLKQAMQVYSIYDISELSLKIKITCHRVIGDGCIWEQI